MQGSVLALDVGASKIIGAIFSGDGRIIALRRIETPGWGVEEALKRVIEALLVEAGVHRVEGAGVAVPGPIDYYTGSLVSPPNIRQERVPVADVVEKYADNVLVANDGVAGVWAEKALARPSVRNAVLVTIGTGIGGGVIVDGRLLIGARGNAHEIGHIVVDAGSRLECGCGGMGHWEALAGGRWIPRTAQFLASVYVDETPLGVKAAAGEAGTEEVYEAAEKGDSFALYVVDYVNRIHAAGIASIASVYDPEAVYLSGGVFARHKDLILTGVRRHLPLYLARHAGFELVEASFGDLQSLYGAYAITIRPPPELVELNKLRARK